MKKELNTISWKWMLATPLLIVMMTGCGGGGSAGSEASAAATTTDTLAVTTTGTVTTGTTDSNSNDTTVGGGDTIVGDGNNTVPPVVSKLSTSQELYVRVIAEVPSEGLKDKGNVLGRINGSSSQYDTHDLVELDPAMGSSSYLTVVFPHEGWTKGDNYASDYHGLDDVAQDKWNFVVRTDDSSREVTLRWEGPYLLELREDENNVERYVQKRDSNGDYADAMYLVDIDRNTSVKVLKDGTVQSYTFNMDGKTERKFQWVLDFSGTFVAPSEAVQSNTTVTAKSALRSVNTNTREELGTPPAP